MTIKIKQLPESERPYEKLELYGEKMLSNAELLAIIIKNGTKENSSVELANKILSLFDNKDLKAFSQDDAKKHVRKVIMYFNLYKIYQLKNFRK